MMLIMTMTMIMIMLITIDVVLVVMNYYYYIIGLLSVKRLAGSCYYSVQLRISMFAAASATIAE